MANGLARLHRLGTGDSSIPPAFTEPTQLLNVITGPRSTSAGDPMLLKQDGAVFDEYQRLPVGIFRRLKRGLREL